MNATTGKPTGQTVHPDRNATTDRRYVLLGLRIVSEFGAIIAVPIVLLAVAGKRLDGHFGTAPMFLIGAFVISFALSAHLIHKKAKRFNEEYQAIGREEDRLRTKDRSN